MVRKKETSLFKNTLVTLNTIIFDLNSNKYLAGISIIIINLCSKYLSNELSDNQSEFISNYYVRKLIIFFIFFIGTKDVIISFILTMLYVIFINHLFNENSKYYLFKRR